MKNNGEKVLNGRKIPKEMIFKVDTSPEHMKKVKAFFKDIEHIKLPYSGVELQRRARLSKSITHFIEP